MRIRHLSIVGLLVVAAMAACNSDDDTIAVGPGGSTRIVALSSMTPSGQYGKVLAESITVQVRNAAGNPVANVPVTWSTTGDFSVAPTSSVTDANGIARTGLTMGATVGTGTVVASVAGVVPNAVFSVTSLPERFIAKLTGGQERPTPNASTAIGFARITWDGTRLGWAVTIDSGALGGPVVGTHIHGPQPDSTLNAGIILDFAAASGNTGLITSGYAYRGSSLLTVPTINLDSVVALLRNRAAYVNVHTSPTFAAGEIRGRPIAY